MQLPHELKFEILKYLDKIDLKAVRLTSKDCSVCTPHYLFDRIYWSPQDLDLEVFQNIASRRELATCVKELVFDGSQFVEHSKEDYFENLCSRIAKDLYCWKSSVRIVSSPHNHLPTMQPNHCSWGS